MSARAAIAFSGALVGLSGSSALADGPMPDGCTHTLTIQSRGCTVEHHYTCEASPGDRWSVLFTTEGAVLVSRIDAEAHWVSTQFLSSGEITRVINPSPDSMSVTELLENGYDSYAFDRQFGEVVLRYEGFDRLTGETVEIDGETLLATSLRFRVTLPETGRLLSIEEGNEYVSPEHMQFFGGIRTATTTEGSETTDHTPVDFIYSGEPGFTSESPAHDCGAMMSALPQPEDRA